MSCRTSLWRRRKMVSGDETRDREQASEKQLVSTLYQRIDEPMLLVLRRMRVSDQRTSCFAPDAICANDKIERVFFTIVKFD